MFGCKIDGCIEQFTASVKMTFNFEGMEFSMWVDLCKTHSDVCVDKFLKGKVSIPIPEEKLKKKRWWR